MPKLLPILALAACALAALPARAHIDMQGPLMSRGGDQKQSPCDGARGDGPVYTFEPGSTITLTVNEVIPHPSYFRIAFDDDGDDAFVEPASIDPIDSNRRCPYNADDQCGESDFCNVTSATGGATVLWDNIDPHLAGAPRSYTWNVKLPDVECDNCVIQVLQVMEDVVHGAYCPTGSCTDSSLEDIYHRCIDIVLQSGATNSPGTTTAPVAIEGVECAPQTGGAGSGGTSAGGAGGAGGAAGSAGAPTAGSTAGAPASAGAGATAGMGAIAGSGAGAPASAAGSSAGGAPGGASGSGGIGTVGSPITGAPPTAGAPASAGSADSGGCAVREPGRASAVGLAWTGLALVLARWRRRPPHRVHGP
jgi:hypothetical protein